MEHRRALRITAPINENIKRKKEFAVGLLAYKIALEISYYVLLCGTNTSIYPDSFSIVKYINGLFWCVILFGLISNEQRKVSTYFLNLTYILQIIPITTIYAFSNRSALYYNFLCICVMVMEMIVVNAKPIKIKTNANTSRFVLLLFACVAIFCFVSLAIKNGIPSLKAFDITSDYIYEYRAEGAFQAGKWESRMAFWTTGFFAPLFLSIAMVRNNKKVVILISSCCVVLFLYTCHKGMLFMLPYIIVSVLFAKKGGQQNKIFTFICYGLFFVFAISTVASLIEPSAKNSGNGVLYVINNIYSLIGRRTLIVPANLKFTYYDFFQTQPYYGLVGTLPVALTGLSDPYASAGSIGRAVAMTMWNIPQNANTGFFVEAYYRFGYIGMLISFILFAFVLVAMDASQKNIGYPVAVGVYGYMAYRLLNGEFFGDLFFGVWMYAIVVILCVKINDIAEGATAIRRKP